MSTAGKARLSVHNVQYQALVPSQVAEEASVIRGRDIVVDRRIVPVIEDVEGVNSEPKMMAFAVATSKKRNAKIAIRFQILQPVSWEALAIAWPNTLLPHGDRRVRITGVNFPGGR